MTSKPSSTNCPSALPCREAGTFCSLTCNVHVCAQSFPDHDVRFIQDSPADEHGSCVDSSAAILTERQSGGYSLGVPPLPIPNREVKPKRADGTAPQCGRVGRRLFFRITEAVQPITVQLPLFLCPLTPSRGNIPMCMEYF